MSASDPSSPFERLMLPHLDAAYNLARWLLRNDHDAEDAVQDAFLRAHQAFARFHGEAGRPWLLTIVRNVCYSRLRKERKSQVTEYSDDLHGSTEDLTEANAQAWRETKAEALDEAMSRLPADFREMIVLHELEGLSYREIAAVTEVPIGTVMSRLARARQKLQAELFGPTSHGL